MKKTEANVWSRAVLMAAVLAGCVAPERAEVDAGAGTTSGLGSTLNVRVLGDSVQFVLHVTNATSGPLTLEFTSTQRQDFEVARPDGEVVWRWSAARSFAQVLGSEVMQPGESRQYEGFWLAQGAAGEYVATGWLISQNYPVELRTAFAVPGS